MTSSQISWGQQGLLDLSTSHPLRQGGKGPLRRSLPRPHTIPINDCFFAKFTLHTYQYLEYSRAPPSTPRLRESRRIHACSSPDSSIYKGVSAHNARKPAYSGTAHLYQPTKPRYLAPLCCNTGSKVR